MQDGTYWLTDLILYTGAGSAPITFVGDGLHSTLVLGAGQLHETFASFPQNNPPSILGRSGTFVTAGNTFTMDLTCGDTLGVTKSQVEVNGSKLSLFVLDQGGPGTTTGTVLVYMKQ